MQTIWVMGNETDVLDKVPRPEVEGYLTYGGVCIAMRVTHQGWCIILILGFRTNESVRRYSP